MFDVEQVDDSNSWKLGWYVPSTDHDWETVALMLLSYSMSFSTRIFNHKIYSYISHDPRGYDVKVEFWARELGVSSVLVNYMVIKSGEAKIYHISTDTGILAYLRWRLDV